MLQSRRESFLAKRAKLAPPTTTSLITFRAMVSATKRDTNDCRNWLGWAPGTQVAAAAEYPKATDAMKEENRVFFGHSISRPPEQPPYSSVKAIFNFSTCTWPIDCSDLCVSTMQVLLGHYVVKGDGMIWSWGGAGPGEEVKPGWVEPYTNVLSMEGNPKNKRLNLPTEMSVHEVLREQRKGILDFRGFDQLKRFKKMPAFMQVYKRIVIKLFGSEQAANAAGIILSAVTLIHSQNRSCLFTYHSDSLEGAKPVKHAAFTAVVQLSGDPSSMHMAGANKEAEYTFGTVHVFPSGAVHRSGTSTTHTYKMTLLFNCSASIDCSVDDDDGDDGDEDAEAASPENTPNRVVKKEKGTASSSADNGPPSDEEVALPSPNVKVEKKENDDAAADELGQAEEADNAMALV